jgi:hypothetical protein
VNDPRLAVALIGAVQAQDFGATPDHWCGGAPVAHFPSIDLAVVSFAPGRPPAWGNVLFSREHPQGLVAAIGDAAGAVHDIRFDADQRNADLDSTAWLPEADWCSMTWLPIVAAPGAAHRVVAPYPASLLKLLVAVGVGLGVDRGAGGWPAALEPMIVVSDNDATTACVGWLHRHDLVELLNARLAELGLATLQLRGTRRDGGWRNADGAGVGQIHMTAWDTARLLWLLDADAPPAPWLPAGAALLQPATRDHLRGVLSRQQLDEVLSSGSLVGTPGWVEGLPDAPHFAHKTGSTANYSSDAGIVRFEGCHYIVALISSLGQRYAPHERCASPWRVQALGAAVHRLMVPAA